ncbi:muconate cycloisomerase family protein [Halomonas halmophila]|uniref:Muconate cycloisomerase n=1 Tax=Halomonas halmophila TaxID=252 RepID=A0A4Y4EYS2_9GAMM|nr:muconate cycloisomerase family protein [Halomonas halmophila]GED22337.1 muconate cycloisomerase [Halomonas halmophila]
MSDILIKDIETLLVDLPTIRAHKLSMTTMACQTMVIIRLRLSDGTEGIGEASTIGGLAYGPESPEGIKQTIDGYLAPLLIAQPSHNLNALRARLDHQARGNSFAKSGLETALLDAEGKRRGLSVAELLGGARCHHLPVLWTLASGDTQKDIDEAFQRFEEHRHCDFKLKIGANSVDQDVRHVGAIKAALGDRASVRVDVNQAWDEATAARGIDALEAAGIDLVEQPVPAREYAGLTRLAQRFVVPMLADEAVHDARDGFTLAAGGFGDAFALKIAKAGGPRSVLELAHVARAAGVSLYGGTMLEGSIGTAAALHAWATLGELTWGTEMFGPLLLKDDIVVEPLNYHDFGVDLPSGPGLGVRLDEDKLNHYRRRD